MTPARRIAGPISSLEERARLSATQSIDVSSADAAAIDTGNTPFNLSGYLGGFSTDGDNATLSITFKSALGSPLGTASIGPVSAADRGNVTGLLPRSTSGNVPTGTRQIDVLLQMTRTAGAFNDGYADNLSLVFTTAPVANDDPTTPGDTNYATNEGSPLTVSATGGVLANDTDPNGDTLTVKDDNPDIPGIQPQDGPSNGTLTLNSDGSFDYTPDAGFSGTDTFTYKANDGTDDSNTATVTITVNDGCTINGIEGGDVLQGTSGGDVIRGKGGNDSISGFSGNDRITGDFGNDTISGGSGRDRISARDRARDSINCGSGIDTIIADRIDNVSRTCERVSRR